MQRHHPSHPGPVRIAAGVAALVSAGLILSGGTAPPAAAASSDPHGSIPDPGTPARTWGERLDGPTTTYDIYRQDFVYGEAPFLITDIRPDSGTRIYSDKESYEIRRLTVFRARDGEESFLVHRPVVFFVHGGGWTDGYGEWYSFVAAPFTGEMGWVTVVVDYRLTSDQVFLADEYCPDRATCTLPENEPYRTKAAWYPDNIDDVASAFRWVVDHIGENGGDAHSIALFGHSAGGHLVSLLATHPDSAADLRSRILGVVSMSGAYQLNDLNVLFWGATVDQTFPGGFGNTGLLSDASPAAWITPGMWLPPFYVLYAEDEMPDLTRQALLFEGLLESAGLRVTTAYLAGYSHVSEMGAIADIQTTPTSWIVAWLDKLFRAEPYRPYLER